MHQNANTPTWVKPTGIGILVVAVLIAWQYAAGYLALLLLFKGHIPITVTPATWGLYMSEHHANKAVLKPLTLGAVVSAFALSAFIVFVFKPKRRSLHGEARLAKPMEIKKAFGSDGIIVGKRGGKYLCAPKGVHINVQAPTGGGKGVAIVIPNLLAWNESAIVLDVKKENWQLTAGFRARHGHKVFLFDPLNTKRITHRWNCFSGVSRDPLQAIDGIQKIAHIWFPDMKDQDPIWAGGARGLFLGLALYIMETGGHLCLGTLAAEACNGDIERFKTEIGNRRAVGKPLSRACELSLTDYFSAPDKTRDSIRKTFTSRLEIFMNPMVDAATRESDFDIGLLRKERITIYLGAEPTDLSRVAPIYKLFFEQVLAEHTGEEPSSNPALKYQLLLLMDEFIAMGRMSQLASGVSFIRGYGIVLMPIYQSRSQMVGTYGEHDAQALLDNLKLHVVFRPTNVRDSEEISKWMGNTTVKSVGKSRPLFGGKGGSTSENEASRALFLPQELRELDDDTVIVFKDGLRPFMAGKAYYYKKGLLIERLKSASPTLAALGRRIPDQTLLTRVRAAGELCPAIAPAPLPVYEPIAAPVDPRPTRPVGAEDMERLDSMSLSDFDLDFSGVVVPAGDMDEDEMADFADEVYQRMFAS